MWICHYKWAARPAACGALIIRGTLYCESLFRLWTLCQRWTLGRNDWDCGCAIICQLRVHWKHESLTDTESIFAHHQYCPPHLSHCDFFTAVKIKDMPSTRLHTLCRGMGISGGTRVEWSKTMRCTQLFLCSSESQELLIYHRSMITDWLFQYH